MKTYVFFGLRKITFFLTYQNFVCRLFFNQKAIIFIYLYVFIAVSAENILKSNTVLLKFIDACPNHDCVVLQKLRENATHIRFKIMVKIRRKRKYYFETMSDLPILCCVTTERLKLSCNHHAVAPIYFQ